MALVSSVEAPAGISTAIKKASEATGTDFRYLLATAARESNFKPHAKARTSSAAGLFQFIENTWLQTIKEEGAQYGLDKYAPHIQRTENGRYYVPNRKMRAEILKLRHDADISAMMAGAFTRQNEEFVESKLGRNATQGELYIAHFLGAGGATRLIETAEATPNTRADRMFPQAAKANRSIFYSAGKPRSVKQVYDLLVSHHSRPETQSVASAEIPQTVASAGKGDPLKPIPGFGEPDAAYLPAARTVGSADGQGTVAQKMVPRQATVTAATATKQDGSVLNRAAATDTGMPTQSLASLIKAQTTAAATKADKIITAPTPARHSVTAIEPQLPVAPRPAAPVRVASLDTSAITMSRRTSSDAGIGSIGPWQTIVQHAERNTTARPMMMAPPQKLAEPIERPAEKAAIRAPRADIPAPIRKPHAPAATAAPRTQEWSAKVKRELKAAAAPEPAQPVRRSRMAAPIRIASNAFDLLQSDQWTRMSYGGS